MAAAISRREIPIVIIELDQQGGRPEIAEAIAENYDSILGGRPYYPTLNTRLGVYIPKVRAEGEEPPGSSGAGSP